MVEGKGRGGEGNWKGLAVGLSGEVGGDEGEGLSAGSSCTGEIREVREGKTG